MPSPKTTTAAELVANVQELHRHTAARYERARGLLRSLTDSLRDPGVLRRLSAAVNELAYVDGQLAASAVAVVKVVDADKSSITAADLHTELMSTMLYTMLEHTSNHYPIDSKRTAGFIVQLAELRDLG